MLTNAFALALVTTTGFVIVYQRLPRKVRRWIENHALLADSVALFLTYTLLGGTLTALTAGAMVGLATSVLFHVAKRPDEYAYLVVAKDYITDCVSSVSNYLNGWARELIKSKKEEKAANLQLVAA